MPDWIERAQQLGRESAGRSDTPASCGDDPKNQGSQQAALFKRQTEFGREIARGVISSTLMVLAQTMGDRPAPPTIEQIHRRMIKVQANLAGHCLVVNVL